MSVIGTDGGQFVKFLRKLIPGIRESITERAVC